MRSAGRVPSVETRRLPRNYGRRASDYRSRIGDGAAPKSEPGRFLVPVGPTAAATSDRSFSPGRLHAPFVAHLIAMRDQVPQMRARRRAEPDAATSRYEAAADEDAPLYPHILNRSV